MRNDSLFADFHVIVTTSQLSLDMIDFKTAKYSYHPGLRSLYLCIDVVSGANAGFCATASLAELMDRALLPKHDLEYLAATSTARY